MDANHELIAKTIEENVNNGKITYKEKAYNNLCYL
jgi:hypothetical protein